MQFGSRLGNVFTLRTHEVNLIKSMTQLNHWMFEAKTGYLVFGIFSLLTCHVLLHAICLCFCFPRRVFHPLLIFVDSSVFILVSFQCFLFFLLVSISSVEPAFVFCPFLATLETRQTTKVTKNNNSYFLGFKWNHNEPKWWFSFTTLWTLTWSCNLLIKPLI